MPNYAGTDILVSAPSPQRGVEEKSCEHLAGFEPTTYRMSLQIQQVWMILEWKIQPSDTWIFRKEQKAGRQIGMQLLKH